MKGKYRRLGAIETLSIAAALIAILNGCATKKEIHSFSVAKAQEEKFSEADQKNNPLENFVNDFSLPNLLKAGATNNPGLRAAFYRWKAALEKIAEARSIMDPNFGYTYYIQEVETRVGPQRHKFSLSQSLPWFGTLSLKGGIAWEKSEQARIEFEREKLSLYYQIKDAYADYYYLGRSISILREKFDLLRQIEKVSRIKYASGSAMFGQIIKLQVELGRLEDNIKTLEASQRPLNSRICALLGVPDSVLFDFPREIPGTEVGYDREDLWGKMMDNNPQIKALESRIQLGEQKISLQKKKYFPDLKIGGTYIQTDGGGMAGVEDRGKDPVMVGASFSIPLGLNRIGSGIRASRAEQQISVEEKKNVKNRLQTKLIQLIFELEDSHRKSVLYRESLIPKASQSLKVIETSFRSGKAGFLDIIDAERVLLQFENIYEKARSDHLRFRAELEMIVGEEI